MNKLIPTIICAATLFGCRSLTPETSWSDYGRYYSPENVSGEIAPPQGPAEILTVKSTQADSKIAEYTAQGYVVLGKFLIADDTEITRPAVEMLAQKLNASAAVWTTANVIGAGTALPDNPAQSIPGVDNVQMARMNADRPDSSFADQIITHKHTIWMLGKKAK